MSFACPNVPDTVAVVLNGVIQNHTAAQLVTLMGASAVKTPSSDFSAVIGGHLISFRKGVPFVTNPALLAALSAQTAPIV